MSLLSRKTFILRPLVLMVFYSFAATYAQAQVQATDNSALAQLDDIQVVASADASKGGLMSAYPGGQVAQGARVGILGNTENLSSAFSTTAYTNKFIQDKQALSIGDVLQYDPTVRIARGYGNFQESYFIRGFASESDDTLYNGLYGILPRQYIASELFERVEVLRGASSFLNGMAPGGGNIGGTISVLPKRAPNEPLNRINVGYDGGAYGGLDVARRFGSDQSVGVRLNAAYHNGNTPVDKEKNQLSLFSLGLDWRSDKTRVSADFAYQNNRLNQIRPNVTLASSVTQVPSAPDSFSNWAQPWTFSNEKDAFATFRVEHDFNPDLTAYAAYGVRSTNELNALAGLTLKSNNGDGSIYRFDNSRQDVISTGEVGLMGKLQTGSVKHDWVLAANAFNDVRYTAYQMDYKNTRNTNLYSPSYYPDYELSASPLKGNEIDDPKLRNRVRLRSIAVGDTLGLFDERLLLTVGARWQEIHTQDYNWSSQSLSNEYQKARLSPALGMVFKINPQLSAYANYVESLAPGEIVPSSGATPPINKGEQLAPYVSKQKEIGLKYDAGRFGAGLALFSTDKPRGLVDSNNYYSASGKDRHQGLELTMYGQALANVRLIGGLTLLDAKQKETGLASTEGKRVIGVPNVQATVGVQWDVPGVEGLSTDVDMIYAGATYADAANTLKVPSWTRFDIGVKYSTELSGHNLTLRAKVNNVANKRYWASVGGYPGSGYLNAAQPRHVALSLTADY